VKKEAAPQRERTLQHLPLREGERARARERVVLVLKWQQARKQRDL
jgi:hypothetical protein